MYLKSFFKSILQLLKILFIFYFLLNTVSIFAEDISRLEKIQLDLYYKESSLSIGEHLNEDIHSGDFIKYDYQSFPKSSSEDKRMFTICSQIKIPIEWKTDRPTLLIPPTEYPANIYLNSHLIGYRGNIKDPYVSRIHTTLNLPLPDPLLLYDSVNNICLQIYPMEGENSPLDKIYLTSSQNGIKLSFLRNFFSVILMQALSICSLLIFFYFLIVYFFFRDLKYFLYFALLNFCFSFVYVNNFLSFEFIPTLVLERIVRTFIPLSVYFIILFYIEYTKCIKKKKIFIVLYSTLMSLLVFSIFIPKTAHDLIQLYKKIQFPILAIQYSILYFSSFYIYFTKKEKKYLILIFAFSLNIFLSSYDHIYFILFDRKPFFPISPFGFFGNILLIFYVLAKEQEMVYREAKSKSLTLKEINETLSENVEERTKEIQKKIISLNFEIQQRIQTEELLKKLTIAVEQSPVSIVITDTTPTIQYVNPWFTKVTGYSAEECIGKNPGFIKGKTKKEVYEDLWITILNGNIWQGEFINRKKNGDLYYEESIIAPIKNEEGVIINYIGIKSDITVRKESEELLNIRSEQLKITIERLKEQHQKLKLAQTQLIQSEKMAGLGTMVAGIAHEVNNPTNYVYLSTRTLETEMQEFRNKVLEMIDSEDKDILNFFESSFSKFQSLINYIEEGTNRITTLVQDLRTFSRLDEAEKKYISVPQTIDSTIRLLKTQYSKNLDIENEYQYTGELECFPAQLNQVLLNIAMNACQAIEEKDFEKDEKQKGRLLIQTEKVNHELLIHFIDNGIGMTEETKQKVFEPFFTTKPIGKGTGLGMSISYGIITKHKGKIEVHSEPGIGTHITLTLPLKLST